MTDEESRQWVVDVGGGGGGGDGDGRVRSAYVYDCTGMMGTGFALLLKMRKIAFHDGHGNEFGNTCVLVLLPPFSIAACQKNALSRANSEKRNWTLERQKKRLS
mmetsp:Transcript_8598/g.14577  ORF Transcript_8598/g.14577 Transcript_8598/m.14577 type:complete len:104 (+) Transcript_8598:58-369(+)